MKWIKTSTEMELPSEEFVAILKDSSNEDANGEIIYMYEGKHFRKYLCCCYNTQDLTKDEIIERYSYISPLK